MSLSAYYKKRNFENTPEPKGGKASGEQLRFVIQRHEATRLHYDLRLEMDGVLKSWAVPKGPSLYPDDKRLAIHTEDHPLDYLFFEGDIPKGNYGAGRMRIWDFGTYESSEGGAEKNLIEGYKSGNLKITLTGQKVNGAFALVRTKGGKEENHWLLIKKKDEFSSDSKYDAEDFQDQISNYGEERGFFKPMLATKTDKIFKRAGWIYELKWDGYRAIADIKNGRVNLYSRNGISFNSKFSLIHRSLGQIEHDAILDGEIVALDENGLPIFQALQNYPAEKEGELRFYVFDMLSLNGHDMTGLPLLDRKSLIQDVIEGIDHIYYCDHLEDMGSVFYEKAIKMGIEGVIAKKADSKYYPGARSEFWLKIKASESQEAIICGFVKIKGGGGLGSLILGMYKEKELVYIGNCGTGFSEAESRELLDLFEPLKREGSPFSGKISLKGRKANWLEPKLICEVGFSEWTRSGSLRHPVYKGLRSDKAPKEITKETEIKLKKGKGKPAEESKGNLEIDGVNVPITNLEKIYWPDEGYSKYDLIDYYMHVSDFMLPYLIDRPQNMHRHPNGIKGESFYQKDTAGIFPHWIETVKVHSKSKDDYIEYMLCQNEATLIYMANLGCIEINPWLSKMSDLDQPDMVVIDLDPSDKNTFQQVIEVAQATKEVLDQGKAKGFCKTSGSSGLHIYIPLADGYSYDDARDFTKLLCYHVHELVPKLTSMERAVKKRTDKIYLDFMQNRKGQTLAAPYCVRPVPGARVSAPLNWEEVKPGLKKEDFTIKTMPQRLEKMGDLFRGVLTEKNEIELILDNLG
ncbi:DNA ligase D [Litoribacter alkaliphilus]|uniref:DNA ligase (ATP) n=1 Tax=Litoribacter ruber TaxID=702568 RepID=A0AAP2CMS2_9BACT|nr:DNA ligase D [Litoribacter alkaliphilus]MBS9525435.1 DNA ligase D [Litoribacter alkaliphilus]